MNDGLRLWGDGTKLGRFSKNKYFLTETFQSHPDIFVSLNLCYCFILNQAHVKYTFDIAKYLYPK